MIERITQSLHFERAVASWEASLVRVRPP